MARKLFALENDGAQVEEMEVADTEVGEVADVQTDVMDDAGDISEDSEGVESGVEAGEDLEKVEDLVEASIENGDGLDPVAAEAIRIAVESICSRVGANPKAVYSLYATENFSSPSSRKSNSRIALEGVKDFLKELWAKIKATLTSVWNKVKAFWAKHVSTLGRVKKALESMKSKVSSSSGKLDGKAYVDEAPSGLVSAFAGKEDITAKVVENYITSHATFTGTVKDVTDGVAAFNNAAAALKNEKDFRSENVKKILGSMPKGKSTDGKTVSGTLIGGVINTVTLKPEPSDDDASIEFQIENESIDDAETKLGISVAGKDQLKSVLNSCISVINETIKQKEKSDKLNEAINKATSALSRVIDSTDIGAVEKTKQEGVKTEAKAQRNLVKLMYKINAKTPVIQNNVVSYNVKLAKAVLAYCSFCLKNYK